MDCATPVASYNSCAALRFRLCPAETGARERGDSFRVIICWLFEHHILSKKTGHTRNRQQPEAEERQQQARSAAARRSNSKETQPSKAFAKLTFEEPRDDHPSEHVGVFDHERLSGLSPASQITRLVGVAGADHLESLAKKDGLLLVLRDAPAGLCAHGVVAACGHSVRGGRSPRAGRVFCLALTHCWHVIYGICCSMGKRRRGLGSTTPRFSHCTGGFYVRPTGNKKMKRFQESFFVVFSFSLVVRRTSTGRNGKKRRRSRAGS